MLKVKSSAHKQLENEIFNKEDMMKKRREDRKKKSEINAKKAGSFKKKGKGGFQKSIKLTKSKVTV